jgi:tRNA (guanosine-2'-O-)-methyltransferase
LGAAAPAGARAEGPVADGPCVPSGPELCFNAHDDNCNGLLDEGCGVRSGLIHFMAAWAEADVDVDLHVTDPGGEVAEVGHVSERGLTKHQDCPGGQGVCYGQNYESVYLEGEDLAPGVYQVRVRLDALGSAEPPIVVRVGARLGDRTSNAVVHLLHEKDERTLSYRLPAVSAAAISAGAGSAVGSTQRGSGTR